MADGPPDIPSISELEDTKLVKWDPHEDYGTELDESHTGAGEVKLLLVFLLSFSIDYTPI